MSREEQRRRTLAEKVDRLFQTVHPGRRAEYSFEEVAAKIRSSGGPTISATYLWQLRKGLRDNPTRRHIEALASFFGVPPGYFFDDAEALRIDRELELLVTLRDSIVRETALGLSDLPPRTLAVISALIRRLRELEGLTSLQGRDYPELSPDRVEHLPGPD
jgi:transcriptional regulator with XRE-family HTH domain